MSAASPTCFIAMPVTTHEHEAERYGDVDHWEHVLEAIFAKAVENAGLEAVKPVAQGSDLIHARIVEQLSTADMVLCDLSAHNPNVFFELGVRTSLNLPIALVRDEYTTIPFDTSGINTHTYKSTLRSWDAEEQVSRLAQHIRSCVTTSAGGNPLWKHFGLKIAADQPGTDTTGADAKIELIYDAMLDVRRQLTRATTASSPPEGRYPQGFTDLMGAMMECANAQTVTESANVGGSYSIILTGPHVEDTDTGELAALCTSLGYKLTKAGRGEHFLRLTVVHRKTDDA